jgi:phage shock protein PspC (stress-responsive transcriptional regulator)
LPECAAGWDSSRLRIVWVLATVFTAFAGVLIYLALWYLMPEASAPKPAFDMPPLQPWKKIV